MNSNNVLYCLPSFPQGRKTQALEHMRPQGAMCSSVDNFQEFGKIPVSTFTHCVKVGKIPIPTNRISIIHIGKIPVFALPLVGKIPTFGWFSVGKSRKNSGFSSINLLSSSAATAAIYTLLKIKNSRSTKNFEKFFMFLIAPALAAICRCRSRRSPSVAASCRKREGEALPCRRGTTIQFSEVIS